MYTRYKYENIHNKQFDYFIVIEDMGLNELRKPMVKVKCKCGVIKVLSFNAINSGKTQSCGCKRKHKFLEGLKRGLCGIYKITSPENKVYIGQSRDILHRWRGQINVAKNKALNKINLSILEYGADKHKFEIVHFLPTDIPDNILDKYEQLYMDLYIDCAIELMNVREAGLSGRFSDEVIQKFKGKSGKWMKGRKLPSSVIKKILITRKINKKPLSEESRAKYINQQLGENNTCAKLSESDVLMIVKLRSERKTIKEVSLIFNISVSGVSSILNGWTWSHITKIKKKWKKRYGRKITNN